MLISKLPQSLKNKIMKTSKEQWDKYYADLKAHEQRMDDTKPMRCNFQDDDAFHNAMVEWDRARFCDAPNEPGYYRANND